jgi:hypothetical protein
MRTVLPSDEWIIQRWRDESLLCIQHTFINTESNLIRKLVLESIHTYLNRNIHVKNTQ